MIYAHEIAGTNVVEITIDGRVSKSDVLMAAEVIDMAIAEHSSVRLLEIIRLLKGFELAALWEDLKYIPSRLKHFSHVAVVSESRWIRILSRVLGKVIPANVDAFRLDELDTAKAWVLQ